MSGNSPTVNMWCRSGTNYSSNTDMTSIGKDTALKVLITQPINGQRGKKKGKEEYLYSAFIQRLVSKRSDMDHTVLPANYTMPAFLL